MERRLEDEVLRRIARDEQLWKNNKIGTERARLLAHVAQLRQIGVDAAQRGVRLRERDLQVAWGRSS